MASQQLGRQSEAEPTCLPPRGAWWWHARWPWQLRATSAAAAAVARRPCHRAGRALRPLRRRSLARLTGLRGRARHLLLPAGRRPGRPTATAARSVAPASAAAAAGAGRTRRPPRATWGGAGRTSTPSRRSGRPWLAASAAARTVGWWRGRRWHGLWRCKRGTGLGDDVHGAALALGTRAVGCGLLGRRRALHLAR